MSQPVHVIRTRRVYAPTLAGEGTRVLVDRLWPRGMKKEDAPFQLQPLLDIARQGPLTLLYAAHDETHNNAVVLADYLQKLLAPHKSD